MDLKETERVKLFLIVEVLVLAILYLHFCYRDLVNYCMDFRERESEEAR
jgi:hypothetical protein